MNSGESLVDFLVIGAQKSASTSLFRFLDSHPQIFMAPGKEIGFFSDPVKFAKGVEHYLAAHFSGAKRTQIVGEASPQYMCFTSVPRRIHAVFPRVKLIAILRNPIERAFSHYRMAVNRGLEDVAFERIVTSLIERGPVEDDLVDVERDYVAFGEYGRILSNYLGYFDREQMTIVFAEDLAADPLKVMRTIFCFLGVSENFNSEIFGRRFHEGGEGRFRLLSQFMQSEALMTPIRAVVPPQIRKRIGFWIVTNVLVKPVKTARPSAEIRRILNRHYASDVTILKDQFGISPPWEIDRS